MITQKNNKLKKIIFAAILSLFLILALRYFMQSAGDSLNDGAGPKGPAPAVATGSSGPSNKIFERGAQTASPVDALTEASRPTGADSGEVSGAALSAGASLNIKPVSPQSAPHLVKQTAPGGDKGIITGNGVNVRRESRIDTTNANVVTKVNKGEQVQILGSEKPANDNKQWYNIKLKNGKTGFVREDLIKIK